MGVNTWGAKKKLGAVLQTGDIDKESDPLQGQGHSIPTPRDRDPIFGANDTLNFYKLGRSKSTTSSRLFQRHTELQNHDHNVKF